MVDAKLETDIQDLTLGVIQAVKMLDVSALSYVQLRHLYAAVTHTTKLVDDEIAKRSQGENLAETVQMMSPKKQSAD